MKPLSQMILRCTRGIAAVWLQAGLRGRLLRISLLTTIFSAVSIWSVWPMPQNMESQIPTSAQGIATVPLFNAWTIAWNAHCAARGMKGYWDAPIFHPHKGTFALSEPQPATLVVAPAIWWLRSPALAYNVYMLLSLTLNGLFTVYLMRTLNTGWMASVVSGIAMIQLPVIHLQIEVLQLMPVWGILWTLAAFIRLHEAATAVMPQESPHQPGRGIRGVIFRGVEAGGAFVAVFAISVHHGIFLTLILAATGPVIIPWRYFLRWLPGAAVALLIALGVLMPLLLPINRVMQEHAFRRSESLVAQLSIKPVDYLVEPNTAAIKLHMVAREGRWHMSPGWTRTVLALGSIFIVLLPCLRKNSIGISFLLAVATAAFLLSLGTNLQIGHWNAWKTLSTYVPGISQVRSAFRFAYFVHLVTIALASVGLDCLWKQCRSRLRDRLLWEWISGGVLLPLALLTMFEIPPPKIQLVGVPKGLSAEWKLYVKAHLKNGNGVLLIPYVQGTTVRDFDVTTRWMLNTVLDDIPMINGYSGFFPDSHFRLQKAIEADPYSDATLGLLHDAKIQFLIAGRHTATKPAVESDRQFELRVVFEDSKGTQVLELFHQLD
jgi:hypothetical protein